MDQGMWKATVRTGQGCFFQSRHTDTNRYQKNTSAFIQADLEEDVDYPMAEDNFGNADLTYFLEMLTVSGL